MPFVMAIYRQVGVQLELPFEILIKHFQSSYSASRGAILEAWKFFRGRRTWLDTHFCTPVYEAVISEAVARGWLEAPGFFDDPFLRQAYLGVTLDG
jgi:capsid protein